MRVIKDIKQEVYIGTAKVLKSVLINPTIDSVVLESFC